MSAIAYERSFELYQTEVLEAALDAECERYEGIMHMLDSSMVTIQALHNVLKRRNYGD